MEGRAPRGPQDAGHQRGARVSRWALFFVYGVAVWWPTRDLPYYWDARNAVAASLGLARSAFVPFHPYFAHPPLFFALLALAWKAFGTARIVSHLVVLPWLPLAMGATYAIGARLDDRLLGLAAAFVFGAIPFVLVEVGQIYFDLPMAALATCGLAAWLHEKHLAACGLFCLAALTKTPALVVPAALVVDALASPALRRSFRPYLALFAPLVVALAWGAYHDSVTGWWFVGPGAPALHALTFGLVVDEVRTYFPYFYLDQLRVVLLLAAVVAVAWRRGRVGAGARACVLVAVAPFLFHVAVVDFLPRYALVAMPPFVVATLYAVRRALPNGTAFGAFAAAVVVLFGARWHPRREATTAYELQPPVDLSYLDHVEVLERAAAFVEARYPSAEILGGFHETVALAEPQNGYVKVPHDVTHCQYFEPHPERVQLVFVHRYGLEQRVCETIVRERGADRVARFEANGKWIEAYVLRRD